MGPEEEEVLTGEVEEPKEASTVDKMKFAILTLLPFFGEVEEPKEASTLDQIKFFLLTLLPFLAGFFLDANSLVQFIRTGNFQFALVSAAIFVMSIWQQIKRGAFQKLLSSCKESLQAGKATDDLELIMLSEKSVEAPLQLMLQWYAFIFVTSDEFAVWSFFVSIVFSFKSVAEAVYSLVELNLMTAMAEEEGCQVKKNFLSSYASHFGISSPHANWKPARSIT